MKRRTFTAEYKTKIILEVLRGEKELNVIATENELAPNQIRNWKAEFLKNATAAFEDKRTEELRYELQSKHQETEELYKKIGQLTTQVDWLKKKSEQLFGPEWESQFTPRPKS
ncbi:MAG TPA: transposase [Bacillota bacterium]|nr:transposase [Bacillota bacterium]